MTVFVAGCLITGSAKLVRGVGVAQSQVVKQNEGWCGAMFNHRQRNRMRVCVARYLITGSTKIGSRCEARSESGDIRLMGSEEHFFLSAQLVFFPIRLRIQRSL